MFVLNVILSTQVHEAVKNISFNDKIIPCIIIIVQEIIWLPIKLLKETFLTSDACKYQHIFYIHLIQLGGFKYKRKFYEKIKCSKDSTSFSRKVRMNVGICKLFLTPKLKSNEIRQKS